MSEANKIYEIIGSSFAMDVKTSIRMGKETSDRFYKMIKHLDKLYLEGKILRDLYKTIFYRSISGIYHDMQVNIASNDNLTGVLSNLSAFSSKDLSFQKTSIDDTEIIPNLPKISHKRLLFLFEDHLNNLDKYKEHIRTKKEKIENESDTKVQRHPGIE